MKLEEIAKVEAELNPKKFLTLLNNIALRVERGNANCITFDECKQWGLSDSEIIHGLFLLVRSGILRQKIAVLNEEEDYFDDIKSASELKDQDLEDIRFWFYPTLKGDDFSPFFCNLSEAETIAPVEGMNRTKNNAIPAQVINQHFYAPVNGDIANSGAKSFSDNTSSLITTGKSKTTIHDSDINSNSKIAEQTTVKGNGLSILSFAMAVLLMMVLIILPYFHEIEEGSKSPIRFILSVLLAFSFPLISSEAKLSGKTKLEEWLPVKFSIAGGLATFIFCLALFNYFKLPI